MKTISFRGLLLVYLGISLLGGFLYLNGLSSPPALRVTASGASSGVISGNVLLPGDTVHTGDRVRVLSVALYGTFTVSNRSRVQFEPGSEFRHTGYPIGGTTPRLKITEGSGVLTTGDHGVLLDFGNAIFSIESGTVRWELREGGLRLLIDPDASVREIRDGNEVPVLPAGQPEEYRVSGQVLTPDWPEDPHPFEEYEQHSLIRPGRAVLASLLETVERTGTVHSPLEAFGHWVRDRWGNAYLFVTERDRIRLRSPGPDESLFTSDDRKWTGSLTRRGN